MARLLGVSRSGFYDWVRRRRDDPWEAAREAVRACWEASCGRFGARSARAVLAARGVRLTLHRVRGLMREPGVFSQVVLSRRGCGGNPGPKRDRRRTACTARGRGSAR
ncbi:IS3 family transposase [Enorma massiliensis]|uniref:IS3 family transposase n=1 Tax=Enorma massiliensis TaxID=1472761 RepID=UPI003B8A77F3